MALPWLRSRMFIRLALISIFVSFRSVNCRYTDEAEFTIVIKASQEQCFYQEAKKGQYLEVEYQVLDADLDTLNIDFAASTADGTSLIVDKGKSESVHRVHIPSEGAVKLCFDNRQYTSQKTVYVELFIEDADSEDEHADDDDPFDLGPVTLAPDNRFNSTEIDQMRHRLSRIYENLNHVERYQEWQKAHEARHRNLVEHLFNVLNTLSSLQSIQMILLLFLQVRVIERFFQPDSFFTKLKKFFVR